VGSETHKQFIKKSEEDYKKIGYVKCPAFSNEEIHFNKIGFNHLLWKGRKMRAPEEQIRRIGLIPKAVRIISTSKKCTHYRESLRVLGNGSISLAKFWSISTNIEGVYIRIIIRQTNNGRKYFLSVM